MNSSIGVSALIVCLIITPAAYTIMGSAAFALSAGALAFATFLSFFIWPSSKK